MTRDEAIHKAQEKARQTGNTVYVVYDPAYHDVEPDEAYEVATELAVDTFFSGAEIVCVAEPAEEG